MTPDATDHAAGPADAEVEDRLAVALAHAGEDPFVGVVSATRTAVAITDPRRPDNPLVFVNDSFCRLTGYDRDELIGRNCRFLQGPDTDPAAIAAIRVAVAAGRPIEVDIRNYRKEGSAFWNRLGIAPVFNDAKEVTFFFASQADVTAERERLDALTSDKASLTAELAGRERAQRDSEEVLRFAAEAAGIGAWQITLPDLTLTATPTLAAVYGLPEGTDPTVEAIRAIAHPDDALRVFAAFDAVTSGDSDDYFVSYRVIHTDGTIGWVEARGRLERHSDRRPRRLIGVSQDVTARREAEMLLALNEESLRLATDAAGVGTWDLDLTSDTLTWSDRTKAMFGISPGVPCSMDDFYAGLHPDDLDATTAAFAAAVDPAVRAEYDVEYRTVGKEDGGVRWVAAKGIGLFVDGVCVRAIGSVVDITRARRAAHRQNFLLDLSDEMRRMPDAQAVKNAAMQALGRELDVDRVGYGTVDDDGFTILLETAYTRDAPTLDGIRIRGGSAGSAIVDNQAGRTIVVGDTGDDPRLVATIWARIGTGAFVSVPLIRDGRFRASLFVTRNAPAPWAADDIALIEDVATRTWDAVERARAEAERNATEAQLRAVIAAAPIGLIFATAPSGQITGGNAHAEQLLRHPVILSPDVEHYRDYGSHHPDGRRLAAKESPLIRALAGEERPEIEVLYHRGDGTKAYLRSVAAPVRGTDGAITGGVVALIDIDGERRADLALRELNATLEQRVADSTAERDAIWRESRDMLLVVTPDGVIEAVNPAWTTTLGYAREELIGHRYSEFLVPDDIESSDTALASIPIEPLRGFANRYRAADGTIHDFAWTAAESNGKMYCIARDVTEEKLAARQLETAQEALRQAQKMEAVGQLTGGIAHDFNNMLAIVLGSLDLLARRLPGDDARARRYVDAATDGARRAATLTQRLLAFSRQQPLQPEPVDVNRLVSGMTGLLRGSLGGGIQLETVLAAGLWPISVDPNQLENVIINLGINARDAMSGDGKVTIETHNCHLDDRYVAAEIGVAAGQYVLIAVSDTGVGMPAEVAAKAFDPFFTTKGVGKGTGLGLSQVYGFVKQSGGHVKIYSEVGVGTSVKLYLPRLFGPVGGVRVEAAGAAPVGGDAGEVILVVEDEPGVRAVTVDALEGLGYRVLAADSASAALALLDANPEIALLFTDIVMPEINGARLAEAARRRRPGLKVLFTTGYTRNAIVHNGVVDPGVELIGKPFTIDALATKVRSVLDAK